MADVLVDAVVANIGRAELVKVPLTQTVFVVRGMALPTRRIVKITKTNTIGSDRSLIRRFDGGDSLTLRGLSINASLIDDVVLS